MKRWAAKERIDPVDPSRIKCVVFDFGFTLSPDFYFKKSPPGQREWHPIFQEKIFADPNITLPWMEGKLTSRDIATIVAKHLPLDVDTILATMEEGCRELAFNAGVWLFALEMRLSGRKTALVTDNMDVFTKVVVPAHKLERLFDVIVNSSDYHEIRKEVLWPIAFEKLGNSIGYENSLLIEDGEAEPAMFRSLGGRAYQYSKDEDFKKWTKTMDWSGWHE